MFRSSTWVLAAWLAASAGLAAGQEAPAPDPPVTPEASGPRTPGTGGPPAAGPETVGATPSKTRVRLQPGTGLAAGVGFSHPLGAALHVQLLHGLAADVRDEGDRVKAVCALPIPHCAGGFLLDAEAGTGGGKLSFGLGARARVEDEEFRGALGVGLGVSVAHTWGSPYGTLPGLTYLGPELDLAVMGLELRLGWLRRIAGEGGAASLFSWGIGVGL